MSVINLITIGDFIRWFESRMTAGQVSFGQGFASAYDEAVYLVLNTLHLGIELRPKYFNCRVTPEEAKQLILIIKKRVEEKIPAAYISHEAWFAGLPFYVDERVLIPRSPFAELIHNEFEPWIAFEPENILELCTGSSCIAIATAEEFPFAHIVASDLSEQALEVANINRKNYQLEDRLELIQSDLFENIEGHFDLIITNPPYVSIAETDSLPEEFHKEPRMGLVSGEDGLDIPLQILFQSADYLTPDGMLFMEVGYTRRTMEQLLPELHSLWVELENGGDGIIACTRQELIAAKDAISDLLSQRGIHV
ncbi:MAG: 50S ribosomal protein L3 N(5)-glutamine methyltransferase [bacterium]